ncbi:MAG TPA: hypothetical protein DGT23_20305 [Micromonosporaceae bacterium]|nr:hypothetical protein [Micromonosporaceae bacterium]
MEGAPRRPATLAIAVWAAVVAAAMYIVGAVMIISGGKESISSYLADQVGVSAADAAALAKLIGEDLDTAYSALVTKAVVAMVVAGLMLVFALLARNGATWARAVLAGVGGIAICGASGLLLGEAAVLPTLGFVPVVLAPWLVLATIVLLFLPKTNRFAKAKKAVAQ